MFSEDWALVNRHYLRGTMNDHIATGSVDIFYLDPPFSPMDYA